MVIAHKVGIRKPYEPVGFEHFIEIGATQDSIGTYGKNGGSIIWPPLICFQPF